MTISIVDEFKRASESYVERLKDLLAEAHIQDVEAMVKGDRESHHILSRKIDALTEFIEFFDLEVNRL